MTTGTQLRDNGQDATIAADVAPHRNFATLVREAVDELCWSPEPFDAEHARAIVAERYPDARPHSANVLPAVFKALAAEGRIVACGWTEATRPEARGRALRLWRVAR